MTTAPAPPRGGQRPVGVVSGSELAYDDVRRTLVVALGSLLGFLPLNTVFSDRIWLVETVGALLCVFVPAALLRLREGPRSTQLLPGLAVVVVYACTLYLHVRSFGGFLPSPGSWQEIVQLRRQAAVQVANNVAPLPSTRALRLEIVPGLALMAAAIDYLAVVRRSPALAGIPLLALFTICGASAGRSVGWLAFLGAGAGFLLILSADARVNLARWGRRIPRPAGDHSATPRAGLPGRRIGVIALVVALVVPLGVPGLGRNLLASTFHHNGTSGSSGGTGTGLSPFASLRGSLNSSATIALLSVHVAGTRAPYYLRSKVLDTDTPTGWVASGDTSSQTSLKSAAFGTAPSSSVTVSAHIALKALDDSAAPAFAAVQSVTGLTGSWKYDKARSTITGGHTRAGLAYDERAAQPDPSAAQLTSGDKPPDRSAVDKRWSALPAGIPDFVTSITQTIVGDRTGAYAIAKVLDDYFLDPANDFTYSLATKSGDSSSDLENFLINKTGFCQQYAAALAVMLRIAGVPSRVVLGYTHAALDAQGDVTVTNHDAHAWVEAYLPGAGWLPFDPTPISAGRITELPYAPHIRAGATADPAGADAKAPAVRPTPSAAAAKPKPKAATAAPVARQHLHVPAWIGQGLLALLVIVALLLALPLWRRVARRRRLRRARRDRTVEPLWDELRAAAADNGMLWGTATTPRQVPAWLRWPRRWSGSGMHPTSPR